MEHEQQNQVNQGPMWVQVNIVTLHPNLFADLTIHLSFVLSHDELLPYQQSKQNLNTDSTTGL